MNILFYFLPLLFSWMLPDGSGAVSPPNIILVMSDDQGWGQTGYNNHPLLKTPNLDAMAANGLRFNRFYAGAPVCSPTRSSVLTGRANDRSAVYAHGYPMRLQEKTVAQAVQRAGYATAHFGKWHLDGLRGPGVPILSSDKRNPGQFGFEEWLSVTNFFDLNPLMSRNGNFEKFEGESSDIIVEEALKFIEREKDKGKPLFVVIWYGSPHGPWRATQEDKESFGHLDEEAQNHYAELVNMDKSIGKLRAGLRSFEIEKNTLLWFNSDNGGLEKFGPETVGGLRGYKGSIYEGGLRVPAILEWPGVIEPGRMTDRPTVTMDIFPTIAEILQLPPSELGNPIDGISILDLFEGDIATRPQAIPFKYGNKGALIDNQYKLVARDIEMGDFELYNLDLDPHETTDLREVDERRALSMIADYTRWIRSVNRSTGGHDYADGLETPDPAPVFWNALPAYESYLDEWKKRPEYESLLRAVVK